MNKNCTRRTTPKGHPKFYIRRSDIAFEKRVRYIESVCHVLIESRFGPGRVEPVVINFSDRPELERTVSYEPCNDVTHGPTRQVPSCYSFSSQGRKGHKVIDAANRRTKQMGLWDAAPNANNSPSPLTPNQGRGSP